MSKLMAPALLLALMQCVPSRIAFDRPGMIITYNPWLASATLRDFSHRFGKSRLSRALKRISVAGTTLLKERFASTTEVRLRVHGMSKKAADGRDGAAIVGLSVVD